MRCRVLSLLLLAGLALGPSACKPQHAGAMRVTVIGATPKMADPALVALSPPDTVLLSSVGQGLVQFDAAGNIVPGLAESWAVSDDGLSYIFRIAQTNWPGGRKVTAQQVAKILKRSVAPGSVNPLKDTVGAVDDIVAMTDRVIAIQLKAPRPNLLSLLAQPEFAIVRGGVGTGPFAIDPKQDVAGELRLGRTIVSTDEENPQRDLVELEAADAKRAIQRFANGDTDIVLGGTFTDLPNAVQARLPRGSLRFDPASGLFGLVPTHAGGPLEDAEVRALLSQSIDRAALIQAWRIPGLVARATLLEAGLDGVPAPTPPGWTTTAVADRRAALGTGISRLFAGKPTTIRLFLPAGPGSDLLYARIAADWQAIGLTVERAPNARIADLQLVDEVAPSASPAWFLRRFRCGAVAVCDPEIDRLLEAARMTLVPQQRYALLIQAAALFDNQTLFIPLTAPVRWSLVSARVQDFAGNRYARHTLTDLEQRLSGTP